MAESLRFFWRILKYLLVFVLVSGLFCLVALVCFEQRVPKTLLDRMTAALSTADLLVTAESAVFRFSHGVTIRNLRVFERHPHPMRRPGPVEPIMQAAVVDLELNLRRIPWERESILKGVTLTRFKYPRLPEGYYIPDSIEFPGQPDFRGVDEPVSIELPVIHPFRVRLVDPDILAVTPKSVEVASVECTENSMRASGVHLEWADTDTPMSLEGEVELDVERQLVRGSVHGLARQAQIRPLLVALDITNSYQFVDAFTEVEPPVEAGCRFDVNLRNNDLHIFLDLHPTGGRHHGVPLKEAKGTVDIRVFVRDTFQNARIVVGGPLVASLRDGTEMEGSIVYENTNDVGFVDFDVRSATSLSNALAIADVMNDGTLDCLVVTSGVPRITLKGRLAVDPAHAAANDLLGTLAFDEGIFFSVPLRKAVTDFVVKGTDVSFPHARAAGPHGGSIWGNGRISIPEFRQDLASFRIDLDADSIALEDIAEVFGFDLKDRHGQVGGHLLLQGPLDTNCVARLSGTGHVACVKGHLAQMKLFAGLSDVLAKRVPALAEKAPVLVGLVNQSRASLDFSLTNGVFRSSNIVVEGGGISIQATGSYDISRDKLDFSVRVTFTKSENKYYGPIASAITWPFANLSKMLFDFKLQGQLEEPKWSYNLNILDRLPSLKKGN